MKTYYESLEMEVISLQAMDAITASYTPEEDELPGFGIQNDY